MPLADSARLNAPSRLAALAATGLMDSLPDEAFNRMVRMAVRLVGAPVAMVSLVGDKRQFFLSQVGLGEPWSSARSSPLSHSFCQHVVAQQAALVTADARHHALVHDSPAIGDMGVVAYAGIPIRSPDGEVLGSFCAINPAPHEWDHVELDTLEDLAAIVESEIALRLTMRELQRVATLKDQLIGLVSHEIRTPLTGILSALRVQVAYRKAGEGDQLIDIALRSAERLQRLTNDLLSVEMLEHGQTLLLPSDWDAAALLATTARDYEATAQERGVHLVVGETRGTARVDHDRMLQVLGNLVSNALKFSPAGSTITLAAEPVPGALHITVRDEGRGIPADMLERIFERFEQVEPGDKREKGGAGLGLAICRAIVTAHGGRIWAESGSAGGSTFHVTLPLGGPEADA
jgi:signal transduction histidine kinase